MTIERELKFSTSEDHVPSLAEVRLALGSSDLELSPALVRRHLDTYYDDAHDSLQRAGWALRRRRSGGATFVTLKAEATVTGALHARREIEVELQPAAAEVVSEGDWPAAIVAAMPTDIDKTSLRPQLELRVRRVAIEVERDGARVAELAFDEVVCTLPGLADSGAPLRESPHFTFYEVEIEAHPATAGHSGARDSSLAALEELAQALMSVLPLTPSATSKLERSKVLLGPFLED